MTIVTFRSLPVKKILPQTTESPERLLRAFENFISEFLCGLCASVLDLLLRLAYALFECVHRKVRLFFIDHQRRRKPYRVFARAEN